MEISLHQTVPCAPELRAETFASSCPESSHVDQLCRLNAALGEACADAILQAIAQAGLTPEQVDLIDSRGQTVWYEPPQDSKRGAYLALGDPSTIPEGAGITTVGSIRARDLAASGRGALGRNRR
ncbi:MAG: anhydro-N-acetylmuramic acid kinase [Chloroflexi bacterium]|nr:anhydro-N-acetylmuramic acid kinase [Chloroflexota bacterium]